MCQTPFPKLQVIIISKLIAFILVFYLPLTLPPPKMMVSRSPTPPNFCTSPPYSPPFRRPIFGWLLCGNSSCGGCLSPQCISCSFVFGCSIQCPKWWYHRSPAPPACRTSPPYSPLLRTLMFGWLLCGNWLVCGCLRPWCIFFFVAQFLPKQWYHISHVPPTRHISPPYSPSLWTPIFGWLLCEPFLIRAIQRQWCITYIYLLSCE